MDAVRSTLIFDHKKYEGLLTVRYLCLRGDTPTGDSILICSPDGKTMLIDAGITDSGGQLVEYLNKLGIEKIDIALLTHPHGDHVGGFARVISEKQIDQFYTINLSISDYISSAYTAADEELRKKDVPRGILEEGSIFWLGQEVEVEVFSPDQGMSASDLLSSDHASINHISMVFKIVYKGNSFLFSTDIYENREQLLVQKFGTRLQADMMHVPHHGSTSSSSISYIETVKPKIAVINFHRNNSVTKEIYSRYNGFGVQTYHAGVNGNILITSNGSRLEVYTEQDGDFS